MDSAQVRRFICISWFAAQLIDSLYFSAIVLSHIVIATDDIAGNVNLDQTEEVTSPPETQEAESDAVTATEGTRSRLEEEPPQKPPWNFDTGGNSTDQVDGPSSGDHPAGVINNFSEAFNVKHLIYFENSSQNDG